MPKGMLHASNRAPGLTGPPVCLEPLEPSSTNTQVLDGQSALFLSMQRNTETRTGKWGLVGGGACCSLGGLGRGWFSTTSQRATVFMQPVLDPRWSWEAGPLSLRLHQGLGVSGALWVRDNEELLSQSYFQRVSCPQILGSSLPEGPASGQNSSHSCPNGRVLLQLSAAASLFLSYSGFGGGASEGLLSWV